MSWIRSIEAWGRRGGAPILLSLAALLVFLVPGANAALEYSRQAISGGELWRVVTGHWTHGSFEHLTLDVLAFAVLGYAVLERNRSTFWWTVLGSAVAISLGLYLLQPRWDAYRGLSGIDSALFVSLAVSLRLESRERRVRGLAVTALLAFAGKVAFEAFIGRALFTGNMSDLQVVPLAHLVGGLVGLFVLAIEPGPQRGSRRRCCLAPGDPGTASGLGRSACVPAGARNGLYSADCRGAGGVDRPGPATTLHARPAPLAQADWRA